MIPASVNKHYPFTRAVALRPSSRNCNPAPDLVFSGLIFQPVFLSGGVFFSQTSVWACGSPETTTSSAYPACVQLRQTPEHLKLTTAPYARHAETPRHELRHGIPSMRVIIIASLIGLSSLSSVLAWRKQTHAIISTTYVSSIHEHSTISTFPFQTCFFVSSWFMKCRMLKLLLAPTLFKIHQRGVQWKQGVVICMMLYTRLLHNTTPIHCTPLALHHPVMNTQSGGLASFPCCRWLA